jgi:two-component system, OmpR family, sensor histidine kinase PhoQ
MTRGRPFSIAARLAVASMAALLLFLTLTAWALERAFERSALQAMQQRLRGYFYSLLQESDVNVKGKLLLPEVLPDPDFERVGSGLYAGVRGEDFVWSSPSALNRTLPFDSILAPGEISFEGPLPSSVGNVYLLRHGVVFETHEAQFTYYIAIHEKNLTRQKQAFRKTLIQYLGGFAVVMLIAQGALLQLSLLPLRQVARELDHVEQGDQEELNGPYPSELRGLTSSFNRVIEAERDNLKRYRNTLGDLAHSLKTPLAVMQGMLDSEPSLAELRSGTAEQLDRMNAIVAYQLARAASSGHKTYAPPIGIDRNAEEIVQSLEKVYAAKGVLCEFELDEQARFHGELGDLMEVLGNLLDNAFKWAKSKVLLTTRTLTTVRGAKARRAGVEICVEDDGPGIPEEKIADMLVRGIRGDERVQGHGIGLSTVSNVVDSYHGQLKIDRSPEVGGARFRAIFPPIE